VTALRTYKRKAAAKVFFFSFAMLSNMRHQLNFDPAYWNNNIFTPKEKQLIERMQDRLITEAELCRQLGWRLNGGYESQQR
jgi:hypothetical protein